MSSPREMLARVVPVGSRDEQLNVASRDGLGWRALPAAAQVYVTGVLVAGAAAVFAAMPHAGVHPLVFAALVACSCLTASWKVSLPISPVSGSTLSLSHAAHLMALLIAGRDPAIIIALIGSWAQCTFNVKCAYPWYRTAFSMATEVITVAASAAAYAWLGGIVQPVDPIASSGPIVGAIATYFLVNSALVAAAIALSLRQPVWKVWHDDFLWSAPSFVVAGALGALAAVVVARGWGWAALLMVAPVYLTYRTYRVFLGRLDEQRRHVEETQMLHRQSVEALLQARRAEQALAAEKERLAVTLRSIADGIISTDLDGTVLSMNRVAETLTGWTQQQAAGQPLSTVFQNFDAETREACDNSIAMLEERARTRAAGRCTILVGRDLAEHSIEESTAVVCDADGRAIGMVLAFRDIKDALRMQEERAKTARLSSLGHLAGGIAHDFNDVLMAITGNVSIARAMIPDVEPASTALAEAEHACVRARQLTWRLLTFSKGGIPHKQTIGLAHVLREAATRVLRGSPVTCSFECAADLWNVLADEGQLIEVFGNILTNAQQAMPHGGAISVRAENVYELTARTEHTLRVAPGRYVRVSIADKGMGIPKENLGRIFDPYFTTKQRGSGLGLATTHSVVKNHGGFVAVDSELGTGTAVHVTLPASEAREVAACSVQMSASRRGGHRVLVMDDEEPVRRLTMNMLQFLGYESEVVDSGNAAIDRFTHALQSGNPFDVVMLDLIVPGGPGAREALNRLALIDPSVKAILMSGYSQDSIISEFRRYGFHAAIDKPFTLQELSATLEHVVASPHYPVH